MKDPESIRRRPRIPALVLALVLATTAGSVHAERDGGPSVSGEPPAGERVSPAGPTRAERREAERAVRGEAEAAVAREREALVQEAVAALEEARAVLELLDGGPERLDEIYAKLRSALGRLDLVIAREPGLAFAPVEVRPILVEFGGSLETVRETRRVIEEMVEEGRLQPARRALRSFAEEIVVRVLSVPLVAHRDALLLTARLVDRGRFDEARAVLEGALAALVAEDRILPLPFLLAAEYGTQLERLLRTGRTLTEAQREEAARSADDGKVEETRAPEVLLDELERLLRRAEAFGYLTGEELEALTERLEEIRAGLEDRETAADRVAALVRRIRGFYGEMEEAAAAEQR